MTRWRQLGLPMIFSLVGMAVTIATADEVKTLTTTYENATVATVSQDGVMAIRKSDDLYTHFSLTTVISIRLSDQEPFNDAEKKLLAGEFAEAKAAFKKISPDDSDPDWLPTLIQSRIALAELLSQSQHENGEGLRIALDGQAGTGTIGKARIANAASGATWLAVETHLQQRRPERDDKPSITVSATPETPFSDVVPVLQILARLNVSRINLACEDRHVIFTMPAAGEVFESQGQAALLTVYRDGSIHRIAGGRDTVGAESAKGKDPAALIKAVRRNRPVTPDHPDAIGILLRHNSDWATAVKCYAASLDAGFPRVFFTPPSPAHYQPTPAADLPAETIYLVDRSATMADHWPQTIHQLVRSVISLKKEQTFGLLLIDGPIPLIFKGSNGEPIVEATRRNMKAFGKWLQSIEPAETTSPLPAIDAIADIALRSTPHGPAQIFFITDGRFTDAESVTARFKRHFEGKGNATVNTVHIGEYDPKAEKALRAIAEAGTGKYFRIEPKKRQPPGS